MMWRIPVLALACTLVAGACDDDPQGPDTTSTQQASAKALWRVTRPSAYTFIASRTCECLTDAAGPVRIEVNGTTIVSVRRVDNNAVIDPALWFTIDDLFNLIDTELAQRPARLEAEYDETNGHPVYVAYGEREVDAGATIDVSAFAPLTGGTGGYLRR
jgi:hypothetical protein